MTWKDVTVWQYQQIQNLISKKENLTDLDMAVKTLAILTDRTETQIDSLTIKELGNELKKVKFITEEMPEPKPRDFIQVGKRRYRCIYDIKKIPYSRYLETKFFGGDVLNNMHKIGASMILPMKLTWRGWKVVNYDASKHEEYANDLLSAPFEAVYGSIVFFCQVFSDSIKNLAAYFKMELMKSGMTIDQADQTITDLCGTMDGFTKLLSSQNTKK